MKTIRLKIRINKRNKQLNVNLPRKKFSPKELDKIQKSGTIKFIFDDDEIQ